MKKALPILLILFGLALLIGAATFWVDTLSMDEPPSLGETLRDWLTTLAGLGTSLAGLLSLLKKRKSAAPTTEIKQDNRLMTGGTVIGKAETVNVYPPAEPKTETHDSLGYIPPVKAVTYVHRGKIESDVEAFLRAGNGAGAIVGLHAPGGLGKTELAKHAADELKGEFEGILWVDVGEKTPPQVVADMLLKCGAHLSPGASYEQQKNELRRRLQDCRLLVILDDVRQKALDGMADFLPSKPCAALLTSRSQQIGGVNKTFQLDHMTPEQAKELLEAVLGAEAVAAEEDAAANLAERCAFNPLALEIAARRARQLQGIKKPIARYFEIVQARFSELSMDGDARWDMEKVFDISYLDLSEPDRQRFRALVAFHPTGFAPEAAAYVWGMDPAAARQALSRFINLSLVKVVEGERERYRLHDLLDEYAGKKLKESSEENRIENTLAEWIINIFEEFYTDDKSTAPQAAEERANLLRCCEWARGQKNGELLARLVTKSRNWFYVSFTEDWIYWIAWLEACLQLGIEDKQLKANVLQAIGDVQQFRKEMDAALASYNEALKLFRQVGDRLGEANVYLSLGGHKRSDDNLAGAKKDYENALKAYQAIGDQYSQGRALYRLGDCFAEEKKYTDALKYYERAAAHWGAIGVNELVESILKPRMEEAKSNLK
ncbi:MAG: NB-ARC domain-containing protein [Chloroflexota bacterium]